ncbi:transcriptional-regulating factor 1 isoform X7 [Dermochelys coriacea]|uniref:transcriptional-regulating factor 1 isoform X7 n=1 Tax=Dermochelys coriacea TaxID=27794 RepID=UPI0018E721C3|nr:transcriptional-regulating factor 1 isoform X7 [Dermochelys coriacea]XP_043367765.1 transcriptional-regulating factor 1 isoform X7 [Dermochelys coriacea]XP_043367767.1 transcriptional-regulating factor 1 isoform X7 [Dermochelys coriacea]XP_043367768.1 transcriptional-regulating factor 1 isoform X7 [Dermochelys coriacea]XP_043367769.1 transcriptional-regulating factor 1 isoform X7 [Dermochelys coriacea]
MGDQQLYKPNHTASSNENLYYQPHQMNSLPPINHSYGTSGMDASQASPLSPQFPQDSRESIALNVGSKNIGSADSSRQTSWTHTGSGNHVPVRNNQNAMWSPLGQNEPVDGYQYSYSQGNELRSQKLTSGVLHKLDSFTQVFANQNLRIQVNNMAQVLHAPSSVMDNASDSALRQLLSQKPAVEQQSVTSTVQRYQQGQPQVHQNFASTQQKQQMQVMQHQQQLYYDYQQHLSQLQMHSAMQQGQPHVQQMQSQPLLPQQMQQLQQTQYYMQQQPQQGQQRLSIQEIQQQQQSRQQQQRQCPMQTAQYYQTQPVTPQLQLQQQQQMPLHLPAYHRDSDPKTVHEIHQYSQDQAHSVQLVQLGTMPQYFYQDPQQQYRHLYPQSVLQQQQQQEDTDQRKQYQNDNRPQALMNSHVGLSVAEAIEDTTRQEIHSVCNAGPHRTLLAPSGIHLNNKGSQQESPSAIWPQQIQLSDGRLQPLSPEPSGPNKGTFPERSHIKSKLTCSICLKEFKSLPALNGHMRSHGGVRASPNFKQELSRKQHQSAAKLEEDFKSLQDKKKYRHRPEPLFIPPPSFNFSASYSGAMLYQSQLRSPRILGDHLLDRTHEFPPYTPPPMLSPVRQGSGLFSSVITSSHNASHPQLPLTPLTPTPRVLLCRSNSIDGSSIPVTPGPGEQTVDIEPQINIGSRFQADIPELQDRSSMGREMHRATLVWKPWPELENKVFQQRVEDLLNMCCSSVLPGGGTNSEYALHSLFESKGDIMVALEMLLLRKPVRLKCHPLANYHYAGSDMWTPLERRMFNKALSTYSKDFIFVQKMVKSKTVAQCVEYYYTWKKIMRLGRKHRTRLAEIRDECLTSGEEEDLEDEEEMEEERKSVKEEESEMQKSPEPPPIALGAPVDLPPLQSLTFSAASFICEMPNCGAVFSSRQALNGHARIHGGTNQVTKPRCTVPGTKQKSGTQSGYCSVKSSPAHSTTSGETDPTTIFPCKECGKVFFKIKSRNAHMKTHRQQEEQQRQKAQKAAVAAEMAATIARTTGPIGHGVIPLDHLSLIKHVEHVDDLEDDVVQELGDVMEETEVIDADLLLDDEDADLLQDDAEL